MHNPEAVQENNTLKLSWDFAIDRSPNLGQKTRPNCYIVTYVDSHLHTCTYICRIIHCDTTIKTQE